MDAYGISTIGTGEGAPHASKARRAQYTPKRTSLDNECAALEHRPLPLCCIVSASCWRKLDTNSLHIVPLYGRSGLPINHNGGPGALHIS